MAARWTNVFRILLILGLSIAAFLAESGPANAYWSTKGSGTGSALTGTLAPPTAVTATASGTQITVKWTASAGTPAPTGYYVTVTPSGGTAGPACGTSATKPITATTCTDTQTVAGNYSYLVVAVLGSWTATSSASNVVTVGPQRRLAVAQNPASQATSGQTFGNVIIQLLDSNGNNLSLPGIQVSIALTTPGSATLSGTTTAATDGNGKATFSNLTIDKVGTYTLTASAPGFASVATSSITITAGQPSKIVVSSGSPQSAKIGALFAQPLVALVTDAAGNPVGGVTVLFLAPNSGASGTFTANNNNQLNATSGNDGLVSAPFRANGTTGSYPVYVVIGSGSFAAFALTNTAAAAAAQVLTPHRVAASPLTPTTSPTPTSQSPGSVPSATLAPDTSPAPSVTPTASSTPTETPATSPSAAVPHPTAAPSTTASPSPEPSAEPAPAASTVESAPPSTTISPTQQSTTSPSRTPTVVPTTPATTSRVS